jgi:hypothetical protein
MSRLKVQQFPKMTRARKGETAKTPTTYETRSADTLDNGKDGERVKRETREVRLNERREGWLTRDLGTVFTLFHTLSVSTGQSSPTKRGSSKKGIQTVFAKGKQASNLSFLTDLFPIWQRGRGRCNFAKESAIRRLSGPRMK